MAARTNFASLDKEEKVCELQAIGRDITDSSEAERVERAGRADFNWRRNQRASTPGFGLRTWQFMDKRERPDALYIKDDESITRENYWHSSLQSIFHGGRAIKRAIDDQDTLEIEASHGARQTRNTRGSSSAAVVLRKGVGTSELLGVT